MVTLTATLEDGWVPDRWEANDRVTPNRQICGPAATCALGPVQSDMSVGFYVRAASAPPPPPPPPPASTTITWTGAAGTSNWLTPGNWDLNRLPGATDDVVIELAGATVDLGDPSDPGDLLYEIRSLRHSGGTLRIRGPSNCANCARLNVGGSIVSTGTDTRWVVERAEVRYRTSASFATLQMGPPGDNGVVSGDARDLTRPTATIRRAEGFISFTFSDVTITETGDLIQGFGLDNGSRLTIGPGATVTVAPSSGSGRIGHGLDNTLVVEGTLRVPQSQFDFGHVTIEAGGVLETQFARFGWGLVSRGTLRGITEGTVIPASPLFIAGTVELEAGSLLDADVVEFRVPAEVSGALRADFVRAAEQETWSFSLSDASLGAIGRLTVGRGPVELGWSADARIDFLGAQVSVTVSAPPIALSGTGSARLLVTALEISGRSLVAGAERAFIEAEYVVVAGTGMSLDNVTLDVLGGPIYSTITGSGFGAAVRGSNAARLIQRGELRLVLGPVLGPANPAVEARSFYFEHRGVVVPSSGASIIRGCITTAGGTIGAGAGTVAFQPLAAGDC